MSGCRGDFQNTKKDGVLNLFSSFKVLIVDHHKDFLTYVASLLHSCSFEVTCVAHSALALKLLSEKENEFDLLLVDSDMTDVDVHTFLRLAKKMDLLSMVMSEDDDDTLVLEAFKSGAFLVLKKPLTIDVVMRIRQHVIKERIKKHDSCQNNSMIRKVAAQKNTIQDIRTFGSKNKNRDEPMKHVKGSNLNNDLVQQPSEDAAAAADSMKMKICLEWTQELHDKFIDAISQLGEGRCYPQEILKLMGVPGLTRMQVASHLQMCRNGKWKSNEKLRNPSSSRNHASSSNLSPQGFGGRKYGRKPSLQIDQNDEDISNFVDLNLSLGWQTEVNHMNSQTPTGSTIENGSSLQNFSGQGITTGRNNYI
ncbi:hypothetical protein L6452_08410 [Arctium lappa]|uniref:Uncharacterized protein n=1 Tax=Arctium lappa TaxID=4217 RepID=A0ACB9DHJ2_ARCLA|nr:hypothetical protein L6452_08410 [Arctium lappa]